MPTLGEPENRSILIGPDGRPAPAWQQWFTRLWRSVAPSDYFYIPSRSGAPTATPETRSGFVPMVYDTANNKLYVYNGAWKATSLT